MVNFLVITSYCSTSKQVPVPSNDATETRIGSNTQGSSIWYQIATTNFTINVHSLLKKTSFITNNNNHSTRILIFLWIKQNKFKCKINNQTDSMGNFTLNWYKNRTTITQNGTNRRTCFLSMEVARCGIKKFESKISINIKWSYPFLKLLLYFVMCILVLSKFYATKG